MKNPELNYFCGVVEVQGTSSILLPIDSWINTLIWLLLSRFPKNFIGAKESIEIWYTMYIFSFTIVNEINFILTKIQSKCLIRFISTIFIYSNSIHTMVLLFKNDIKQKYVVVAWMQIRFVRLSKLFLLELFLVRNIECWSKHHSIWTYMYT